jgi:hypothetical protein
LVRALRGDRAVPLFDVRDVWHDPESPPPTVRRADGTVLFRAGSEGARTSAAIKQAHANCRGLTAILNALPSLLAAARERDALREALEQIANGTTVVLANGHERPTCLAGKASQALARAAIRALASTGDPAMDKDDVVDLCRWDRMSWQDRYEDERRRHSEGMATAIEAVSKLQQTIIALRTERDEAVARERACDWQPIETAPMYTTVDFWIDDPDIEGWRITGMLSSKLEPLIINTDDGVYPPHENGGWPTHWRPLPSPPIRARRAEDGDG